MSMAMIERAGVGADASVVDVGGGTSRLVDVLVARRQSHVTVLDISQAALDVARRRLGSSPTVSWVRADLLSWEPERTYDVWHDRAVSHFMLSPADVAAYRVRLEAATRLGATAVFGCFAPDGPTQCSGLPTARRDAGELAELIGPDWRLLTATTEEHTTPQGVIQPFTWAVFRRRAGADSAATA
jgi:SAM-dependent methyltransferase